MSSTAVFHRAPAGRILLGSMACAVLFANSGSPSFAQERAAATSEKPITIVVGNSPGGGYDLLARTIARHLGKELPGSPQIIVQNMPGGGSLIASNYLYSVAPKDGSVISSVSNNIPFEPLFGTKEARYDPLKFNWLGTPSQETGLLTLWHTVPVKTLDDLRRREITVGSTGENSTPSFYARLLNELHGSKIKVIVGYRGQNEMYAAMERGELDASSSVFYSSLVSTRPSWLPEGKVRLLVQYGQAKHPKLPDVPFFADLIDDPDDKALIRAAFAPLATGRPYAMPPGVPPAKVAEMRAAFTATFSDPDFIADANKQKLDVSSPMSGEELTRLIAEAYKTPEKVVARLQQLSGKK